MRRVETELPSFPLAAQTTTPLSWAYLTASLRISRVLAAMLMLITVAPLSTAHRMPETIRS